MKRAVYGEGGLAKLLLETKHALGSQTGPSTRAQALLRLWGQKFGDRRSFNFSALIANSMFAQTITKS
jgi:hypothetical protein